MISFGDFPEGFKQYDVAGIVIVPVPYDMTSTWMKGSDKGPKALLEASRQLEWYDIETNTEVFRQGIFTANPVNLKSPPETAIREIQKRIKPFADHNKFLVILGGEHSISLAPVITLKEKFPDMSVLQLDAHADLRPAYEGSSYNHACVMARIKQHCPIVQVGIRSMDKEEKKYTERSRIYYAEEIYNQSNWMDDAIQQLSEDVYVTIDLDVLDPAIMPSTGTPEPGGLYWYQLLKFLKKVARSKNIAGFDVVELCPQKSNKSPDFIAAKLVYKLLSYIFQDKNNKQS